MLLRTAQEITLEADRIQSVDASRFTVPSWAIFQARLWCFSSQGKMPLYRIFRQIELPKELFEPGIIAKWVHVRMCGNRRKKRLFGGFSEPLKRLFLVTDSCMPKGHIPSSEVASFVLHVD